MGEQERELETLLAQELQLFEDEYDRHYLPGETKPHDIGRPYLLRHPAARTGVLLVHGLMAAPEEVRQLADFIHAQGYTVYAPRMAGHGTSALDLAQRSPAEWIASVERGHTILQCCCERIVAAGFSTGAAIMLQQVIQHPNAYAGLISISAPLKFKKFSARFARPLATWNRWCQAAGLPQLAIPFATNHADNPHINYLRCPVRSIAQIQQLMRSLYRGLPGVTIPALVIHANEDPKVDVQSGRDIHARLGSANKHYREIAFRQHGIVRGDIARQVFAEVGAFLRALPDEPGQNHQASACEAIPAHPAAMPARQYQSGLQQQ